MEYSKINSVLLACLVGISGFIAARVWTLSIDVEVAKVNIATVQGTADRTHTELVQLKNDFNSWRYQKK